MKIAMLIDMVHGTFFQKFTQKWQVTNWAVVRRDEIQLVFRRG